jgi:hypothetical protein
MTHAQFIAEMAKFKLRITRAEALLAMARNPDPKALAMQRATNFLSAQRRPDGRPSFFIPTLE